jgi:hypothetical protein
MMTKRVSMYVAAVGLCGGLLGVAAGGCGNKAQSGSQDLKSAKDLKLDPSKVTPEQRQRMAEYMRKAGRQQGGAPAGGAAR